MSLKTMSVAKLTHLKGQVEIALRTQVANRRSAIESDLARLVRLGKSSGRGRTGKIPAKYRNPDNPSETWAGRGLKPRWLAAALKSGRKLEHFAVDAQAQAAGAKRLPTKTRRARKGAKK